MRISQEQIPVPEKLDKVVEQKMEILYREQRVKRIRRSVIGIGTAAACFMGVVAVGITNPAWASQLPLIGHIFEQMQDKFGYPGDYSQAGTPLETEEETLAGTEQNISGQAETAAPRDSRYTKTVGDMTVTLSEVYCNGQSLNITLLLESKEAFPDTMRTDYTGKGDVPILACRTEEDYSFNPSIQHDLIDLEGDFIDEHTFAGLIRIDLNKKNQDTSKLEEVLEVADGEKDVLQNMSDEEYASCIKEVEIPDSFSLNLTLNKVIGYLAEPDQREFELSEEEILALSDEEWVEYMKKEDEKDPTWNEFPNAHENYWFDGPWEFELEVTKSEEGCVTVELGTANDAGVGMEKIVKTPFEITMYPLPAEDGTFYFPVMLDADGMLMQTGGSGGAADTVAIGDHDVSTVDVYLFEDTVWLDEVKEYYWSKPGGLQKGENLEDGRTFKELCNETCVYHETVEFPD